MIVVTIFFETHICWPDGEGWSVYYAVFAREGFTEAAETELKMRQGLAVDLAALDEVLSAK